MISGGTPELKHPIRSSDINWQKSYYDVLGLPKTATNKEVKDAYFKLSRQVHPDRDSSDKSLHARFVEINEAYSVLSRADKRQQYDYDLAKENDRHRRFHRSTWSSASGPTDKWDPNHEHVDWQKYRKFWDDIERELQAERKARVRRAYFNRSSVGFRMPALLFYLIFFNFFFIAIYVFEELADAHRLSYRRLDKAEDEAFLNFLNAKTDNSSTLPFDDLDKSSVDAYKSGYAGKENSDLVQTSAAGSLV